MAEPKVLREFRGTHAFTLLMLNEDGDKWEGRVVRYPHPTPQELTLGEDCGPTCRADSEKGLKIQLDAIVNEFSQ